MQLATTGAVPPEKYSILLKLAKEVELSPEDKQLFNAKQIRRLKWQLSRRKWKWATKSHLLSPQPEDVLVAPDDHQHSRILLKTSQLKELTQLLRSKYPGEGSNKILKRSEEIYIGLTRDYIQKNINEDPAAQKERPKFINKIIKPIIQTRPMQRLLMDLVDMKPLLEEAGRDIEQGGHRYVLSIEDCFSRFLFLRPLINKTAVEVASHLWDIIAVEGQPEAIQTDNGTEFKGVVEEICFKNKIKLIHGRPYHPQSQGKIERSHLAWKKKMRAIISNKDHEEGEVLKWQHYLQEAQMQYNDSFHLSIGMSPFRLFRGRNSNRNAPSGSETPDPLYHQSTTEEIESHLNLQKEVEEVGLLNNITAADHMAARFNKGHPVSQYQTGDRVYIRIPKKGKLSRNKFVKQVATVIKPSTIDSMYSVLLEDDSTMHIKVADMTSLTHAEEKLRPKTSNTPSSCMCGRALCKRVAEKGCNFMLSKLCCISLNDNVCGMHKKVQRVNPKKPFRAGNNICYLNAASQIIKACLVSTKYQLVWSPLLEATEGFPSKLLDCLKDKDYRTYGQGGQQHCLTTLMDILELEESAGGTLCESFSGSSEEKFSCSQCHDGPENQIQSTILSLEQNAPYCDVHLDISEGEIEDVEGMHCSSCQGIRPAIRTNKVIKTGKLLLVIYNRFQPNVLGLEDFTNLKVTDPIPLSYGFLHQQKFFDLIALTVHRGGSITNGHYVAMTKNASDEWYLHDDDKTTFISWTDVLQQRTDIDGAIYSVAMNDHIKSKKKTTEIDSLPNEVLQELLMHCFLDDGGFSRLAQLGLVCKRFNRLTCVNNAPFWKMAYRRWLESMDTNDCSFVKEMQPLAPGTCVLCKEWYMPRIGFWGNGKRNDVAGYFSDNLNVQYCDRCSSFAPMDYN